MLELTMPHIFETLDIEHDDLKEDDMFLDTLATRNVQPVSDETRLYLSEKLSHEIDLYDFITNLFANNYNSFVNSDGSKRDAQRNRKKWNLHLF